MRNKSRHSELSRSIPLCPSDQSKETHLLDSASIWDCMSSNSSRLQTNATSVSLSFVQKAQGSGQATGGISTCVIHFIHPSPAGQGKRKPRFYVHLSNQTCTDRNLVSFSPWRALNRPFLQADYEWDRVVWTGCEPRFDPMPDVLTFPQEFWVTLCLDDVRVDYAVRMEVSSSSHEMTGGVFHIKDAGGHSVSTRPELEVVYLSGQLGKCQASNTQTSTSMFIFRDRWGGTSIVGFKTKE